MEQILDRISKAPTSAKVGGIAVILAILTGLNFWSLIQPAEDRIAISASKLVGLEQQLSEKQAIAQNLNERRKEMEVLEQQLAEALTQLPEAKEIGELLGTLNDIGKKSGLEIAKIEPGAEAPAGFYSRIPVKMAVTGNYHEIAMFLQEIANMRRIVNVNNIKMSAPELKNDKVVLKSEFLATTFRFLDQSANQGTKGAAAPKGKK